MSFLAYTYAAQQFTRASLLNLAKTLIWLNLDKTVQMAEWCGASVS